MKNNNNLKQPDEIQAELDDPNQKQKPGPDPFKAGEGEQKGILDTPPDEQQYEREPEPPLAPDFMD